MPAVFDNNYVTRIHGENVKQGKTKRDLAEQLRQDIRDFKAKNKLDRLVIVWCASTEVFIRPGPQHATIEQFEKAARQGQVRRRAQQGIECVLEAAHRPEDPSEMQVQRAERGVHRQGGPQVLERPRSRRRGIAS